MDCLFVSVGTIIVTQGIQIPHIIDICSKRTTRDCKDAKPRFGIAFTARQEFKCDPFLIGMHMTF